MRTERRQMKNKKSKKFLILSSILVVLLGIGLYIGYVFFSANHFFNQIQGDDLPNKGTNETDQVVIENKEPFSILLLGVDERPGDKGRADTILVATINPNTNDVKLLSIPRDTLIELPKSGELDKINATYAYDGIPYVVETVEDYLDIPINYYAKINFQGMVDLVNAIGGITIDSPLDFTVQDSNEHSNAIQVKKGVQHMDGEKALGYARMRKQDPRGDWGRQERQRQVIEAIIDEIISISSLTNFNRIFNAIAPNLTTNLSGREIWILGTNYASAANKITSLVLEGEEDRIYFPSYGQEVYVWKPNEDKKAAVSAELRRHLELEPNAIDSSETDSMETSSATSE